MKITNTLLGGLLIVVVINFFYAIGAGQPDSTFGAIASDKDAYSAGTLESSTTLVAATAKSAVSSTSAFTKICNPTSTSTIWAWKSSTSTGVYIGGGTPLYPSSTQYQNCEIYGKDDPYTGEIYLISSGPANISIDNK